VQYSSTHSTHRLEISSSTTRPDDHKYTGKELDEDTGLYYYGARYYNASLGIFISQDPVYLGLGTGNLSILHDPQSLNSYSYARNNPIANNDPTGEFWNFVLGAVAAIWNTVVDPVVTAFSVVQAVQNPSPANVGAAGLDVGFLLSPLPAGAGIAVNLAQTGSVAKTAENVVEVAKSFNWKSADTLWDHFERHGGDFGSGTVDNYANTAREFYQRGMNEFKSGIEVHAGSDDIIRMYDKSTNTFGAYNSDGTTATFFKPDRGADYWTDQRSR
jgi:RHS repeat-associated protein